MTEKGVSLQICDLKKDIADVLNKYKLPMLIKRMTLQEILTEVIKLTEIELQNEQKTLENEKEKEQSDDK